MVALDSVRTLRRQFGRPSTNRPRSTWCRRPGRQSSASVPPSRSTSKNARREIVTITAPDGRTRLVRKLAGGLGTVRWVPTATGTTVVNVRVVGLDGTTTTGRATVRVLATPPVLRLPDPPRRGVVGKPVRVLFRVAHAVDEVVTVSTRAGIVFDARFDIDKGTGVIKWVPQDAGPAVLRIRRPAAKVRLPSVPSGSTSPVDRSSSRRAFRSSGFQPRSPSDARPVRFRRGQLHLRHRSHRRVTWRRPELALPLPGWSRTDRLDADDRRSLYVLGDRPRRRHHRRGERRRTCARGSVSTGPRGAIQRGTWQWQLLVAASCAVVGLVTHYAVPCSRPRSNSSASAWAWSVRRSCWPGQPTPVRWCSRADWFSPSWHWSLCCRSSPSRSGSPTFRRPSSSPPI